MTRVDSKTLARGMRSLLMAYKNLSDYCLLYDTKVGTLRVAHRGDRQRKEEEILLWLNVFEIDDMTMLQEIDDIVYKKLKELVYLDKLNYLAKEGGNKLLTLQREGALKVQRFERTYIMVSLENEVEKTAEYVMLYPQTVKSFLVRGKDKLFAVKEDYSLVDIKLQGLLQGKGLYDSLKETLNVVEEYQLTGNSEEDAMRIRRNLASKGINEIAMSALIRFV